MKQLDWHGMYRESWSGQIVPDAFSHPAKFSRALIRGIYSFLIKEGMLRPGDEVLDPFGGVALGARDALALGLQWVGIELEEKFYKIGGEGWQCPGNSQLPAYVKNRTVPEAAFPICATCLRKWQRHLLSGEHHAEGNLEYWNRRWGHSFRGKAVLFHGDSRGLSKIIGGAGVVVSSSPYSQTGVADHDGQTNALKGGKLRGGGDKFLDANYGSHPANLGNLKARNFDAVVASPPFQGAQEGGGINKRGYGDGSDRVNERTYNKQMTDDSPGQLGAMKSGDVDAVIGSSPYSESIQGKSADARRKRIKKGKYKGKRPDAFTSPGNIAGHSFGDDYGNSPGQPGAMKPGDVTAVISSSPYAGARIGETSGQAQVGHGENYGKTDGQLANFPAGDLSAVISSSPYSESAAGAGGLNHLPPKKKGQQSGRKKGASQSSDQHYGKSTGQLSNMPAIVSSPPYEASHKPNISPSDVLNTDRKDLHKWAWNEVNQGQTDGQLGNSRGEDFWSAAQIIVAQCYQVLKPGGVAAWICKDFVRNKKIVPFADQWRRLCESVGFEATHRIRAWVIEDKGTQIDLEGNRHKKTVQRKSFFRRIHEQKHPGTEIDFETVWVLRKPQ